MLTFVLRNCLFPLYHVIMAFGRDPVLSHETSYRRSATNRFGGSIMFTVKGFTVVITIFNGNGCYLGKIRKNGYV